MKRLACSAVLSLAVPLSACGDHLGAYEVEEVRLVDQLPQNDTLDWPPHPYAEFLRIEVSSTSNLSAINTGPGVYTDADFCPLRDAYRLLALGPIANDETFIDGRSRHLIPDRRDGRYHYLIYVVPSSSARKLFSNSVDEKPPYDLRKQGRDLCLRLFLAGYNLIPSRSDVIKVPAKTLADALRSDPSPAARKPAGSGTR